MTPSFDPPLLIWGDFDPPLLIWAGDQNQTSCALIFFEFRFKICFTIIIFLNVVIAPRRRLGLFALFPTGQQRLPEHPGGAFRWAAAPFACRLRPAAVRAEPLGVAADELEVCVFFFFFLGGGQILATFWLIVG